MEAMPSIYELLFESIGEGIVVADRKGYIELTNPSLDQMFGYRPGELIGQRIEVLVPSPLRKDHTQLREMFEKRPKNRPMAAGLEELKGVKKNGRLFPVEVGLNYLDRNGLSKVIAIVSDITQRKKAQCELHKEKARSRLYLNLAKAMFIVLDTDMMLQFINQEGCRILEVKDPAAVLGMNWVESFVPPDNQEMVQEVFQALLQGQKEGVEFFDNEIITLEGKRKMVQWHNSLIKTAEGGIEGMLSSGIDVTDRFDTEKVRTTAMLQGQEQERQRIATELHDGLVQTLSAISLNLKALEDEIDRLEHSEVEAYKNAMDLLDHAIQDTRLISHDLMPSALERFGLIKAMEDLVYRTSKNKVLIIDFKTNLGYDIRDLYMITNLYRILQELLQNIVKHAQASEVEVELWEIGNRIRLRVKDNGVGFEGSPEEMQSNGIGLRNISTRVKSMNGKLVLDSTTADGTTVVVEVPSSKLK